jgi:ATP-binding cassette, subfamily B, heavy metal transporter
VPPVRDTTENAAGFATLKRFLPYLWPRDDRALRLRVVGALLLVLAGKAVVLFGPYPYKWAIDAMSANQREAVSLVMALVAGYAAARFGGVVFDNIRNTVFERVGQDATRRLAVNVFAHLHALSMRFHLSRRTGAVTKIIERGTKSIDVMLYFLLFNIAPTIIELVVVLITFQLKFGFWLVAATIVMVIAYGWFTTAITNWRAKLREEMNELDTNTVARAVDSLLNYETVKYFNAEARETRAYEAVAKRYAAAAVRSENSLSWLNIGQSLITNLMMAGAMGFVVWGWSSGRFTTGDVVFVSTYLAQLFRPLDMLGMVYRTIRQGLIDMGAMFALTDTPAEIADAPDAQPLAVAKGAIRFEGVQFSYDPERLILNGIDFEVPAGTTLAVVGPSGAGKSTLARLLFRFYDVTGGRITIDGQDLRDVTQSSLRAAIGIVPQDTVLFNDTIGYNIAYGREGADQAAVEAAARGAAIHGFIASLPKQYDEMVGERGLKLSGGEKQRVAIARTLIKNPPVLILDEATSALDSRTEAAIQTTLQRLSAHRTTIVIAHRLSTIADADQIIVLEAGNVVERGAHADLLALAGLYAEMWARQQAEADDAAVAAE